MALWAYLIYGSMGVLEGRARLLLPSPPPPHLSPEASPTNVT